MRFVTSIAKAMYTDEAQGFIQNGAGVIGILYNVKTKTAVFCGTSAMDAPMLKGLQALCIPPAHGS